MTASQSGADDEPGPVDFLAIEFPAGRLTSPGFERLLSLADQGVVDILDMEFIARDADGHARKVDVWEFAVPAGPVRGVLTQAEFGQQTLLWVTSVPPGQAGRTVASPRCR